MYYNLGERPMGNDIVHKDYTEKTDRPIKKNVHKGYKSPWTITEERVFKDQFVHKTLSELKQLFPKKSESALKNKARELHLKKPTNYSPIWEFVIANIKTEIISGVYILKNINNNRFYVGSSHNIFNRVAQHMDKLIKGKHHIQDLQQDWTANSKFVFYISYMCDISEAENIEYDIINTYINTKYIYNKNYFKPQPSLTEQYKSKFKLRFYKENVDECWDCGYKPEDDGYCNIQIDNKEYPLHRISYFIHYNEWPNGNVVMHKCNNKVCVNPNHLKRGSNKENAQHYVETIAADKPIDNIRQDWLSDQYSLKDLANKYNLKSVAGIVTNNSHYNPEYIRPKKTTRPYKVLLGYLSKNNQIREG